MKLYTYAKCGTCRKAVAWLKARGIDPEEMPIRERPPSKAELKRMLKGLGGELRRLFNTSGQDYRALNLKDRLPNMSVDEAIRLLAGNGNLVKRPFLLTDAGDAVGFDEARWSELLGG